MEDSISTLLYGALAALSFLGPVILRALKKRQQKKQEQAWSEQEPTPAAKPMVSAGSQMSPVAASVLPSGRPKGGQYDVMLGRVARARERVASLKDGCRNYSGVSGELASQIEILCGAPLSEIEGRLQRRSPDDAMTSGGISSLGRQLGTLERRVEMLDAFLERRIAHGGDRELNAIDNAVQDLVSPWVVHGRRMGLKAIPFLGMGLLCTDEHPPGTLPSGDLRIVELDISRADAPRDWVLSAADVCRAYLNSPEGIGRQLIQELGLPDAMNAMSHFFATGRLTTDALFAGWMPQLVPDILATAQMGPPYALALRRSFEESGGGGVQSARVDDRLNFGPVPHHLRVYATGATLGLLGYTSEAEELWSTWDSAAGNPQHLFLETDRFPRMPLPIGTLLSELGELTEKLVGHPMSSLGGYPVSSVPDLICTSRQYGEIKRAVGALSMGDVPAGGPKILLGAASMALGHDLVKSSFMGKRVLTIMAEGGRREVEASPEAAARPRDLIDALRSPLFPARAIAVGAMFSTSRGWKRTF